MSQLSANKNNARAFVRAKFSPNNPPHSCGRPPEPHPTHPHLHHEAPEAPTSGVASENAEARTHSHTRQPRERTTNNRQGSPKAPHHGPCMTPGRHHGPGHMAGDDNHTPEHRCQQATTRDGPPATNNRIRNRAPPDDEQGEPLHPPPPLPLPGNTLASRRSVQSGDGACLPHAPATTTVTAIVRGHTMNRGCRLHARPLPSPGPTPQHRTEVRDAISGTYACDQQPTVAIVTVCGHHNELGVPAAPLPRSLLLSNGPMSHISA